MEINFPYCSYDKKFTDIVISVRFWSIRFIKLVIKYIIAKGKNDYKRIYYVTSSERKNGTQFILLQNIAHDKVPYCR